MNSLIELIKNKATLNYGLAIVNMILWSRLFSGGFIVSSFIVVLFFYYASIITTGKLSIKPVKNVLFYVWLINVIFYFAGALFGSLGVVLASLFLLLRITYRAINSDTYKSSVNSIVKNLKGEENDKEKK